jgi:DNA replication protein DnaC
MANPPPGPDPEALRRSERHARWSESSVIRDRLPRFLVAPKASELASWVTSRELLDAALKWNWGGGNLLLLGSTGKGKSTAAGILFRRLLRDAWYGGGDPWVRAQGMRWVRAQQLEREVRAHPLGKGECDMYRDAVYAKLLFLDEVGWEGDHKLIAGLLAARYDLPNPTIITSNWGVGRLRRVYGDAVARRMIQGAAVIEAFDPGDPDRDGPKDDFPRG